MKFCWSTLNVKNIEETIKFYENIIGLEVINRFNAGPQEIVFMGTGVETQIEFICDGSHSEDYVEERISWGFEVESLDTTYKTIKENGIEIFREPFQPNPHVRFFFIKDPNGMLIQLVEHIK